MAVPKNLCLLPWVHAHLTAQGHRALCAVDLNTHFDEPVSQSDSLEAHWNGEELREVRRQMLSDTLPARCTLCRGEGNRAQSLKDEVAARWPHHGEIVVRSTATDGSTTLRPFSFDYRSSVCNLKCRTCGPTSSTTAEHEARHHSEIGALETKASAWDRDYRSRRDGAMTQGRRELLDRVRNGEVRHLYWAGGEPLFDETHWVVMNALIASEQASAVDVAYNTNLTLLAFKGQSVETIWPHFRSVHVQASIDGVGDAGEYIRTGFRTELFSQNLDRMINLSRLHSSLTISLDVTITSVGLLYLGDLLAFALERDLTVSAKLMHPRAVNYHMAVEFLPSAVRQEWCNRWMDWILRYDTHGRLGIVYDVLLHCLKTVHDEPDLDRVRKSFGPLRAFEAARGDRGAFKRLCAVDKRLAAACAAAFSE